MRGVSPEASWPTREAGEVRRHPKRRLCSPEASPPTCSSTPSRWAAAPPAHHHDTGLSSAWPGPARGPHREATEQNTVPVHPDTGRTTEATREAPGQVRGNGNRGMAPWELVFQEGVGWVWGWPHGGQGGFQAVNSQPWGSEAVG